MAEKANNHLIEMKKQYDLFCPIWGVAYVSGMPIFFIGEENLRFLKPMNKRTCYNERYCN